VRIDAAVNVQDDERNEVDGVGGIAEVDAKTAERGTDGSVAKDETSGDHGCGDAPDGGSIPAKASVENALVVAKRCCATDEQSCEEEKRSGDQQPGAERLALAEPGVGETDDASEDELEVHGVQEEDENGPLKVGEDSECGECEDGGYGALHDATAAEEEIEGDEVVEEHLEDERPTYEDERSGDGEVQGRQQQVGVDEQWKREAVLLDPDEDEEQGEDPVDGEDTDEAANEKVECPIGALGLRGPRLHGDGGENEAADGKENIDAAGSEAGDVVEVDLPRDRVEADGEDAMEMDDQKCGNRAKDLNGFVLLHR